MMVLGGVPLIFYTHSCLCRLCRQEPSSSFRNSKRGPLSGGQWSNTWCLMVESIWAVDFCFQRWPDSTAPTERSWGLRGVSGGAGRIHHSDPGGSHWWPWPQVASGLVHHPRRGESRWWVGVIWKNKWTCPWVENAFDQASECWFVFLQAPCVRLTWLTSLNRRTTRCWCESGRNTTTAPTAPRFSTSSAWSSATPSEYEAFWGSCFKLRF